MSEIVETRRDPAEGDPYLARVKSLILDHLAPYDAAVTLFGSRARGTADPGSDVDVAVSPRERVPVELLPDIAEALEESTIPYRVDLLDLRRADSGLRAIVAREGIPWRS
jgi:hypothetical protein